MWIYITFILSALIAAVGFILACTRHWIKVFTILIIAALCVAQFLAYRKQIIENQVLKESGTLKEPTTTLLSPAQQIYPRIKIGNTNTYIEYTGPAGEPLIRGFEDVGLTIWIENSVMKLSTKIRDKDGELIAEIIANEWKTKLDKRWDRNYNRNALEVKDATGDVVLQVIMCEDCIQFSAKMYSSNGDGFAIGSNVLTEQDIIEHKQGKQVFIAAADGPTEFTVGMVTGVMEFRPNPPGQSLQLVIDPIFRYPSDQHLGELLDN